MGRKVWIKERLGGWMDELTQREGGREGRKEGRKGGS